MKNIFVIISVIFLVINLKAQFFPDETYYINSLYFTRTWVSSQSSIEHMNQYNSFQSKLWGLNYEFFYTNYRQFGISFYGRSQLIGDGLYLLFAIIDGRKIRPYSNTLLEMALPLTLFKTNYLALLTGPSFNLFAFEIPQRTDYYDEPFVALPLGIGTSATLDFSISSKLLIRTYANVNFYRNSKKEIPLIYNGWARLYIKPGFFIGFDMIKLTEVWNPNTNEKINCLRKDLVIGFSFLE